MLTKSRNKVWPIVLIILAIAAIYSIIIYNKLVKLDENVKLNWANLQNTYQRRLDLTPNLVTVVKGSSDYEKQTLAQLAAARAKASQVTISAVSPDVNNYNKQEQAQAEVVNSLNRLIAIIERYPDLKSTKNFLYLQSQLEGTERRIKVSRNDFNAAVAQFNKLVRSFPSSIIVSLCGYRPKEGFKSETGSDKAPDVKF